MDEYIKQYHHKEKIKKLKANKLVYVLTVVILNILLVGLLYLEFCGSSKLVSYIIVYSLPNIMLTSAITILIYKYLNGYFIKGE